MFGGFNVLTFNMSAMDAQTRADRLSKAINETAADYLTLLNKYFEALVDVSNKLNAKQPDSKHAEQVARQAKNDADKNAVQNDKLGAFKAYHAALINWHKHLKYLYKGDEVIIQKDQQLINKEDMNFAESASEAAQTAAQPAAQPQVTAAQTAAQPQVKKKPVQRSNSVPKLMQVKYDTANSKILHSQDDGLDLNLGNPNGMNAANFTIRGNSGGNNQKTRKYVRFAEGSRRRKGRKTRRR